MAICIHSDINYTDEGIACGAYVALRSPVHGWLCLKHYLEQQQKMPLIPRKPRYLHIKHVDEEVIASILDTDREAIKAGKVVQVSYGKKDPAVIKFLES